MKIFEGKNVILYVTNLLQDYLEPNSLATFLKWS